MNNVYYYFLLFYLYCVIGYIAEVLFVYIVDKKWVNRGYLIGPYLPIYGVGAMLINFLLYGYYNNPIIIFVFSLIICSAIEYLTSYLLEKIFKSRWWDYSYRKYHINGRICLLNSVLFGLGGVVIIYGINPILESILLNMPFIKIKVSVIMISIIFMIDLIISTIDAYRVNHVANHLESIINEYTKNKNIKINKIKTRLFDAFPYLAKNKGLIKKLKSLKKVDSKR